MSASPTSTRRAVRRGTPASALASLAEDEAVEPVLEAPALDPGVLGSPGSVEETPATEMPEGFGYTTILTDSRSIARTRRVATEGGPDRGVRARDGASSWGQSFACAAETPAAPTA